MVFGVNSGYQNGVAPGRSGGASDANPIKLMRSAGFSSVSGTFTVPSAGLYQIALWGAGGVNNSTGGGAGGLAVRILRLFKDDQLPYVVAPWDDTGTASTITFRDGVMTALSATTATGVGASGPSDGIYQTGANGSGGVGGTAPSYSGLMGGTEGVAPGGGGNGTLNRSEAGMLIITKIAD